MDGRLIERDLDPDFDEHAWLLQQAAMLRADRLSALDTEHLAEFLESMARSEVREVASRLKVLFVHLLKYRAQPERAGRSWALSILNAQDDLADLLAAASLRREAEALMPQAWQRARKAAAAETGLPLGEMPDENPWSLDDALAWNPPGDLPRMRPRPRKP
jgi:hypothetical protein